MSGMDRRPHILGIPINALPMSGVLSEIDAWIDRGEQKFICTADVHALVSALGDPSIRRVYESAAMVTADGMPLVWYLRDSGFPKAERVCGPDLMSALFQRSQQSGYSHFLYGASKDTLARMTERLAREFPRAKVAGTYSPPYRELSDAESHEADSLINAMQPDIVWVGLGAPKQDRWMVTHRPRLNAPVLIGVGAAFDMFAGTVRRAPRIVRKTGFEWTFRVAQEPRRLAKRYFVSNSRFAAMVIAEKLGRPTWPSDA